MRGQPVTVTLPAQAPAGTAWMTRTQPPAAQARQLLGYLWAACAGAATSGPAAGMTLTLHSSSPPVPPGGPASVSGTGYTSSASAPRRWPGGLSGFDGRDQRELAGAGAEPDFVAGTVRGYRWWSFDAPDLNRSAATADQHWAGGLLTGQWGTWTAGVNAAVCRAAVCSHAQDETPADGCSCGYWAYWQLQAYGLKRAHQLPVCGVIEGWGKTQIGDHGFRCAKARIVALHLPLVIEPRRGRSAWERAGFRGTVWNWDVTAEPGPPDAVLEADTEAWMAVMGDRLAQLYPGVRIFETRDAMLAAYPPDPGYWPPRVCCEFCGMEYVRSGIADHLEHCEPARRWHAHSSCPRC